MEPHRDDTDLIAALTSLRPTPRPGFTAELDARAAAGFPTNMQGERSASKGISGRLGSGRLGTWLRGERPRLSSARVLAPIGACALLAIVVATAVVSINDGDRSSSPEDLALNGRGQTPPTGGASQANNGAGGSSRGNHGSGVQFESPPLPVVPSKEAAAAGTGLPSQSASSASAEALAGPVYEQRLHKPGKSGPYAAQTGRRDIERAAQIVLATEADEVRAAAGEVFATVHSYNGIVLESAVNDNGPDAEANFELLIPSAKVSDALADFSEIAEVRSREEATADITAPTVSLEERMRDGQARIESLLGQLADADTDGERVAAETELRGERARLAVLRSRLSSLERRASFSKVSLRIESGPAGGADSDDGKWGISDALRDAGEILATAGAVAVVGLAFIVPFALIFVLVWLARRAWIRRSRDRALD